MKRIGIAAFAVTTGVLVPTTFRVLHAGRSQIAKLVAADEQSIRIGDARVDVSLDSGLVEAGGKLHVTVTATADKTTKVPLAVLVYEQEGTGGGRMEIPPERIGRADATLDVDGKASRTFAFTLPGYRPSTMGGLKRFGHYTVYVVPGQQVHGNDMPDDGASVARLDVATHTPSDSIAIVAADTAAAGDVPVQLKITNPTGRAFNRVNVSLAVAPTELSASWKGIPADQVFVGEPDEPSFALAPHETKLVTIHVHSEGTGTLGLFASVQCVDGEDSDCWRRIHGETASRLNDSVLDAIDIVPAPAPSHEQPGATTAKL